MKKCKIVCNKGKTRILKSTENRIAIRVGLKLISFVIFPRRLTAELSGGADRWLMFDLANSIEKNERKRLPRPSAASG